ncbi:MAG TPA: TetR/AcrR family transcriptional regulator [Usitatibacter sp.]|jgi:AcrR family transcriptional regulator|nr:TetR/AcrR family transcriptional regulator [Usitatibacter sp.]
MPRPSRNLDRALLAAGRELFPRRGCAGLAVREVAEAAGVNLGMFHYHFKSREAFLRALLQGVYEEMYSQLSVVAADRLQEVTPLVQLRSTLRFMGRFLRANRPILARVLADALCGEPIAIEFVRDNFPRHVAVIRGLVGAAQEAGEVRALPAIQLMAFCAGSVAAPILFGGAVIESGELARRQSKALEEVLLSDAAIDERIDLALATIAVPATPSPVRRRKPRRKERP